MKYQRGFSVFEGLLILIVLAGIGFGGWYVWQRAEEDVVPQTRTTYQTQQECEEATGSLCGYVTCDFIPAGKTIDEVCGENFDEGWQANQSSTNEALNVDIFHEESDSRGVLIVGIVTDTFNELPVDGNAGIVVNDTYRVITDSAARIIPGSISPSEPRIDIVNIGDAVEIAAFRPEDSPQFDGLTWVYVQDESRYVKKIVLERLSGIYKVLDCTAAGFPCSETNIETGGDGSGIFGVRDRFELLQDTQAGDTVTAIGYYESILESSPEFKEFHVLKLE